MATEKKGVMVYLPTDLEQLLEKYCTDNDITRKGKDGELVTSMGTGIVHYLKSQLIEEPRFENTAITGSVEPPAEMLTSDNVLEMIRESMTPLADELAGLRSEFSDLKSGNSSELENVGELRADIDRKIAELQRILFSHQH